MNDFFKETVLIRGKVQELPYQCLRTNQSTIKQTENLLQSQHGQWIL